MPQPSAGAPYIIQKGDTLWSIAKRAYGDPLKWRDIWNANQTRLRSQNPDLIFPGETILLMPTDKPTVPGPEVLPAPVLQSKNGVALVLNGKLVQTENIRVVSSMENAADGWSATIKWEPGEDIDLDAAIRPFSYSSAQIYIQGELVLTGRLYGTKPELSNRNFVQLSGASLAADMVDSNFKPPFEEQRISLKQRAKAMAKAFGVSITIADNVQDGVFDRVTIGEEEKVAEHLQKLASQRAALITSTPDGGISIIRAATTMPVGTIEEGKPGFTGFVADYDGRKRFHTYRVVQSGPNETQTVKTVNDPAVPVVRFQTMKTDDLIAGEIENAALWRQNKGRADALTIPIVATGYVSPNLEIWRKNTRVVVKSPSMFVPGGEIFLIKQCEYVEDGEGMRTILTVVPADSYTIRPMKVSSGSSDGATSQFTAEELRKIEQGRQALELERSRR